MAFDVGAGLAKMGETVSQVATAGAVEAMRGELEKERIRLAGEIAKEGRVQQHGLDMEKMGKQQEFMAGESKLDRQNRLDTTKMTVEGHIQSAGIGAGATIRAAEIGAAAREREHDKTLAFSREQLAATIASHSTVKINEDGTASLVNPVSGTVKPLVGEDNAPVKFRDPERAKAQSDSIKAIHDSLQSDSRMYEIEMRQVQAELKSIMEGEGRIDPNSKAVKEARARVDEVKQKYEPRLRQQQGQLATLINGLLDQAKLPQAKSGGGKLDLNKYLAPTTPAPTPGGPINNY